LHRSRFSAKVRSAIGRGFVKAGRTIGVVALVLIVAIVVWLRWKGAEPRRLAVRTLGRLDAALHTGNSPELLKLICTPAAIQGRTAPEQAEFLRKALADEISPEGLAVLERQGSFGPLTNLFPDEAEAWAKQASVKAEDCLAFKLDRNGLRAEVVLARLSTLNSQPSTCFQIVRCNNVKQLAQNTGARANRLDPKTP
jgi:hypothetical protein